ncbi:MAG: hypothetical protein ACI9WL_000315 [Rubritalea sp.]|jgi:hypothetical protein
MHIAFKRQVIIQKTRSLEIAFSCFKEIYLELYQIIFALITTRSINLHRNRIPLLFEVLPLF